MKIMTNWGGKSKGPKKQKSRWRPWNHSLLYVHPLAYVGMYGHQKEPSKKEKKRKTSSKLFKTKQSLDSTTYYSCVHLKKSKKKSGLFFGFYFGFFSRFFFHKRNIDFFFDFFLVQKKKSKNSVQKKSRFFHVVKMGKKSRKKSPKKSI